MRHSFDELHLGRTPARETRSACRVTIAIATIVLILEGCGSANAGAAPPASAESAPRAPLPAPPRPAIEKPTDTPRKALYARVGQEGVPAIVRDVRRVHLAAERSSLSFRSLPVDFDGYGIALRPTTGHLDVLEMRVLGTSPAMSTLLANHVGKHVRVRKGDDHSPWEEGTLIGIANSRAIVSVNGDVAAVEFEHVALTDAPAEPVLEASVQGDTGDVDVELTYSTTELRSTVSYRLLRGAGTTRGWLGGYATITNETGTDLPDAAFTMTADVPSLRDFSQGAASKAPVASLDTTSIRFTSPMSIPAGRSVSTRLFGPSEVTLTRRIVIEGPGLPVYAGSDPGEISNASIRAVLDGAAVGGGKLSPLGMLPGTTELFEGEVQATEPPRWYGGTASRPLPGGVGLRVDLGDERQFDIRRRLVGIKNLGRCVTESSWEVSVTNPTEEPIPFEDVEPVSGDYVVLDSSLPATASEKDYFGFGFPVAGKATVRLKFRARVTSCVETTGRRGYWYTGKPGGKKSAS